MLCINYDRPSHLRFTWSESDGEDLFEQLLDDLRVQAQVSDQATTTPTLLNSQILVAQHRRQYRIEVVLPFAYVPSPVNLSEELVHRCSPRFLCGKLPWCRDQPIRNRMPHALSS